MEFIKEYGLLVLPLILINLVLIFICLKDLFKREKVTGNNKWLWAGIIIFIQFFGPVLYLVFGKKED
ncbi:PLD nuclease N-terminal domain-containing protein [bacterium]|nr:PLD nuclease N-terminal domain-containing protein [bacterium]